MKSNGALATDALTARQRTPHRRVITLFLLFLLLGTAGVLHAVPPAPNDRGSAQVSVITDLSNTKSNIDLVDIKIDGNTDKALLQEIVQAVGTKFGAKPTNLKSVSPDPQFSDDNGIGLDFNLPIVPRNEEYLPIAPFIEALAPYARDVRIVYVVYGEFTYKGIKTLKRSDVTITVNPPEIAPIGPGQPVAFYSVDVTINNPKLDAESIPKYEEKVTGQRPVWIGLLLLAGIFAILAVILVMLLSYWKSARVAQTDHTPPGG
ncbi:MAG: hypothetical protein ACYDBB_11550 [Armatimonadota bacterium]